MKNYIGLFALLCIMTANLFAQSLSFNQGQHANIPVSEASTGLDAFTFEFWYFQTGFSGGDEWIAGFEREGGPGYTIRNDHNEYQAGFSASDGTGCYYDPDDYNEGEPVLENQWTHLAISYDLEYFYFFVNGLLIKSELCDVAGGIGDISSSIDINYHTWSNGTQSSSRLTGQIDELRISNMSRYSDNFIPPTQEFVPDEFTAGLWHFNNDFNDYSGNNNHGTHVGTSYSENTPILVNGCTDPSAINYDAEAVTDDGSCIAPEDAIFGCMDEGYIEFDENANISNSNLCLTEIVNGCIDINALNYSSLANTDDGSCEYPLTGCTDSEADNYNALATMDDGSCQYEAILECTDPNYLEYDAQVTSDDGPCITLIVYGCTDSLACNYNPEANMADGICEYADLGYDCDGCKSSKNLD